MKEVKVAIPISFEPVKKRKNISLVGVSIVLFAAGFVLPVLGLIFVIVHAAVNEDNLFGGLGTVCLIASIPLLMFGSHLMDVHERKK